MNNRVIIKRVTIADGPDLIRVNEASRDYHRPWADPFIDEAGFNAWFSRTLTGPVVGLVARERASDGVIGIVNINESVAGTFQSAYLGYYGMAQFARRGLITEALRLSIAYAFGELGLHRLEANIQPGNLASIALLQKLGFCKEGFSPRYLRIGGIWCDHERWAILADAP